MFCLCVFLFLQSVCAYEITTKPISNENSDNFDLPKNTTVSLISGTNTNATKTIIMDRITQPSQTQQIERTLEAIPSSTTIKNSSLEKTQKGTLQNFNPSPQLETYYEYNKFPVEPALPEAKSFGNSHGGFGSWTEAPVTSQWINKQNGPNSWSENPRGYNSHEENHKFGGNHWLDKTTTDQPWVSRVKFPSSSYIPANERPYQFVTNNDKVPNYSPVNFPTTTEGFSFNKPVQTTNKHTKPTPGFWEKLMGYGVNKIKTPEPVQKTFNDYNLLENPPHQVSHKEYEHAVSYGDGANPWKKIIKLLTAVIPIGLLISALTPTVITVTSVNDTQSRYRAENSKHQEIVSHLTSSLNNLDKLNENDCEGKILCEILVGASISKHSEEHIENLLNTFTEQEDIENKKDLIKIFDAVKNGDCSSILCENIKSPT